MKYPLLCVALAVLLHTVPAHCAPFASPTDLSVAPAWASNCASCNMPMPHLSLAWEAVPGAASYTVFRDGVILETGVTASTYTDMAVQGGRSYSYTVAAVDADGAAGPSADPQVALAPVSPEGTTTLLAPVNLSLHGVWMPGSADRLSWTPVAGAIAYNIYQYGNLIGHHIPRPTFRVLPSVWKPGLTYTVTSLDAQGAESVPSNPVTAQGANDPDVTPAWVPGLPVVPTDLLTVTEWNGGLPRVHLTWHGDKDDFTYNVFRDGQRVAHGLWALSYLDTAVTAGETHTYTVSGVNISGSTLQQSAHSHSESVTVDAAPVTSFAQPKFVIDRVAANDDSAEVFFEPVSGAVDYRIYDPAQPGKVKYAGVRTRQTRLTLNGLPTPLAPMHLSIEWNGVNPAQGTNLVVEAVDKLGPFQTMDGAMGPGAMNMDGSTNIAINGQGDPSNQPTVLARSDVFHVMPKPFALTGAQAFFDTFRNEAPLVRNLHPDPDIVAANPGDGNFGEWSNDKWTMRCYQGDLSATRFFFMGNHFMDTLYDGGTAGGNIIHNNNASDIMMPRATADISGGRVLHVTFEVDAHFDGRRWCDLFVGAAGDPLLLTGKFAENNQSPTTSGNLFRWEIRQEHHDVQMFLNGHGTDVMSFKDWNDQQTVNRVYWDYVSPLANGTDQDLDKRHIFDLYLSQTHFRVMETTPDGKYSVIRDGDLPSGQTLPFDKAQVYFVHQLYHTGNDRDELVTYQPWQTYWHNLRPWCDERHWDNMGFEVLNAFPAAPRFAPLPQ